MYYMKKLFLWAWLFYTGVVFSVGAVPNSVLGYIPQAEKIGEARLSVLFWDVYDATLYAPNKQWIKGKPLALKLDYLRTLEGESIAYASKKEILKMGYDDVENLQRWLNFMKNIFPNVKKGDSITGIYTQDQQTIFLQGNDILGVIEDPEFGLWFFDIWLSEKASYPDARDKLLSL
jgi:hypothetical protein